ncbi:MAG TPA: redoxin family protein [Candidatus Binataceae bacterium]|nr:redoxin family protein [Candidatus Binataceae bacterium]
MNLTVTVFGAKVPRGYRTMLLRAAAAILALAMLVMSRAAGVRAAIERVGAPAPDFSCQPCLNHAPFKLSDLRGKVVLVDFWEYTCINCIRTFPYLRRWDALYRPLGLVIVGVHTPEFEFAKNASLVADATRRFGFEFPIAIDSDYKIWYAFHNEGWPADYLIDKYGNVAYMHVGEGEYGDFEQKIQQLLKQANPALNFNQARYRIPAGENVELGGGVCMRATPETYLGFARSMNIANEGGEGRNGAALYAAPAEVPLDDFALNGRWLASSEYVRPVTAGKAPGDSLVLHYRAKSVYLVAGSDESTPRRLYLTQDGRPIAKQARGVDVREAGDGRTYIELGAKRMYYAVNNPEFGGHLLKLEAPGPGLSLYSFTFGNNCENKFAHR